VNVHLKKGQVLIRHFVSRVEQLNSYLGRLPGVIDCPKAIKKTKRIEPFDGANLAKLILKMCPMEWQNQFSLSQGIIPQDMQSLLDTLETIENSENNKKLKVGSGEKKSGGNKGGILKSKTDKKCKVSFRDERVPKKARDKKLCDLCKKHGGAHTTHNTGECRKYDKGRALKKGFKPKGKSKSKNESFAQIMKEGFTKATKAFEKDLKKASCKEKKHKHDSDDSKSS